MSEMSRRAVLVAFLLCTAALVPMASALDLVKEGRPVGEIVLPDTAHSVEAFAAKDFQHWVHEITGATVPIVPAATSDANTKLFVGKPAAPEWKADLAKLAGTDGFAVRNKGASVFVFGDLPRGTAYGLYHLLETNTDIIWARPDESFGSVFNKTGDLALTKIDALELPAFSLHGWNVVAIRRHRPTGVWVLRNRGNFADQAQVDDLGMVELYGGGHSYFSTMVPPNSKFGDGKHNYFATNPEFYGWDPAQGGRCPETLCLTCPQLPAVAAANLAEGIAKRDRPTDYLHLGMRDSWTICQCPECRKPIPLADGTVLAQRDADTEKDPLFASTRYFLFMNRVAAEFRKLRPDMKILVASYFYAAVPPACNLDPAVLPFFCPIGGRSARYPLLDPKQDTTWRERFTAWRKKAPGRLCFYEYYRSYGSGSASLHFGATRISWAADLRDLAACGGRGVISELTPDVDRNFSNHSMQSEWDANGIDAWVLARLLWNPAQDVDALQSYYLDRTFREAAPAMKRFYALMQEGWDKCDNPKKGFQGTVIDAGIEKACVAALDDAEKTARHPASREIIRRLRAQWDRTAGALNRAVIPNIPNAAQAFGDFDSPLWQKALVLDNFRISAAWDWAARKSPRAATRVNVLRDAVRLCFRFAASGPAPLDLMPSAKPDTWPLGDHGEIYLQNKSGAYLFAFDGNGNRYDALDFDRRWNSAWELKTRRTGAGWEATVAIPLADLKYKAGDESAALSLFIVRCHRAGATTEESTWNGGVLGQRERFKMIMEPEAGR